MFNKNKISCEILYFLSQMKRGTHFHVSTLSEMFEISVKNVRYWFRPLSKEQFIIGVDIKKDYSIRITEKGRKYAEGIDCDNEGVFCTSCGANASKSHKFCAKCGEKIN